MNVDRSPFEGGAGGGGVAPRSNGMVLGESSALGGNIVGRNHP